MSGWQLWRAEDVEPKDNDTRTYRVWRREPSGKWEKHLDAEGEGATSRATAAMNLLINEGYEVNIRIEYSEG